MLLCSSEEGSIGVILRYGTRLGEVASADPGIQSAIDIEEFAPGRFVHGSMPLQYEGKHCANHAWLHELMMGNPRDAFVDTTRSETPACVLNVGTVVLMGHGQELALSVEPHFRLQKDRVGVENQNAFRRRASYERQLENLLLDPALPIFGDKFVHGGEGQRYVLILIGQKLHTIASQRPQSIMIRFWRQDRESLNRIENSDSR